jgi:hypothetical protein
MKRVSTAWVYVFALGIFVFGIAWPSVGPLAAEAGFGGDGLVAHWKFEAGSGNEVEDSSGNSNNGIIVPASALGPKWGTGKFAGSISFNGDNIVRISPSESLNKLKRQITVVAHIYPRSLWTPSSTAAYRRLWRKAARLAERLGMASNNEGSGWIGLVQRQWRETAHPDQYYLGYGQENNVLHYKWHLGLIGGTEVDLYRLPASQDKPVIGEWVHLAGTYNGDTGKTSLYVNGKLIGTELHVGEIRLDLESLNRPLVIGGEINGSNIDEPSNQFDGYVDDVRIYDRALSDEEIETLAENAKKEVTK